MKTKILFWIPLTVIAVLNGLFRTFVLTRFLEEQHARQISSLMMLVLLFWYTEFVYDKLAIRKASDAWTTGVIWLLLTVALEFCLGFFVSKLSLQAILADYNMLAGRLWPLVLLGALLAPYLYYRFGEHDVASKAN